MDTVINVDRLTQWCVPVLTRGRLIQTRNPLRENMDVLDERVRRADHADDESLCHARRALIQKMLERILCDPGATGLFTDIADGRISPISDMEGLVIINNYTIANYAACGHQDRARALMLNPLSLIAEDDAAKEEATVQAAPPSSPLPVGRVINGSASRPITPADVS